VIDALHKQKPEIKERVTTAPALTKRLWLRKEKKPFIQDKAKWHIAWK
jgi:hypothetical protein